MLKAQLITIYDNFITYGGNYITIVSERLYF